MKLGATVGLGSATTFWNLNTGKPAGKIDDGQSLAATRVVFLAGPHGWIARGDFNQTITIWPMPDKGAPQLRSPAVKILSGHTGLVVRMRVTPDGRLLSEGQDKVAILWDPLSGRLLARYDDVAASRLSEDGIRLTMIDSSGVVRMAHLPPAGQALIAAGRARPGDLTLSEKAHYFPVER